MKAAIIHNYSEGFSSLSYEEVETPKPGVGEVLIRVKARAVNHCDTDLRKGIFGIEQPFPWVMGVDACGEIAELGDGVSNFSIGDRVAPHFLLTCNTCQNCLEGKENICERAEILGVTVWGGYGDYLKCKSTDLIRIPETLSDIDAAAGQLPFATAWESLIVAASLSAGESVLITAAGGGVGSAAIQVAKLAGARVIAAAGESSKLERARALGADEVINYTTDNIEDCCKDLTNGRGIDCALEMIGGTILKQTIGAITPGGRVVVIGAHGGEQVEVDFVEFFRKHITVHGAGRSTKAHASKVLSLMANKQLIPVIHKTFHLSEAAEAHKLMESRNFFGRMILTDKDSI
tara:strand:+ start:70737 stop:71780 length:1044 start_codon:yes stop_codon:yes gene_type:complete